ncbi:amino acid ABC transporter permease [Aestuariivirga sp.]|uniref:amino acid ABC transporter permease n=1 Tax=Aestuariivirga sp. TaxID=2650926 RepID=UPI00391B5261
MTARDVAWVRSKDAPLLPPPAGTAGATGWLRQNLFGGIGSTITTVLMAALLALIAWTILDWAVLDAVWTGQDREACAIAGAGACWPFVWAKFPQWVFGFYPIEERWRPALVFLIGAVALVPMLMPSAPGKLWNALFLILAFPVIALILLTGGNFDFGLETYAAVMLLMLAASVLLPLFSTGLEEGIKGNTTGVLLALIGLLPVLLWILAEAAAALAGLVALTGLEVLDMPVRALLSFRNAVNGHWATPFIQAGAFLLAAGFTLASLFGMDGRRAWGLVKGWLVAAAAVIAVFLLLDMDFGLQRVETSSWGGLLVTLVVSVTGIAASLPLGILLALGRRSSMPVVRLFSVIFIELWRGVPLITVLFMASVMLPLFLPEGASFDKLLRALIGISLFSSAYMAEVVRGGLQAIGKGQYEGAMALGLSWWQMTAKIVLPQALKISIPNIVSTFIGLFKDTTLVLIIGIYDFLGIITAGTQDAKWASEQTGNTGYFVAAIVYWAFCFGMSRYAIYTERRLSTGHKR